MVAGTEPTVGADQNGGGVTTVVDSSTGDTFVYMPGSDKAFVIASATGGLVYQNVLPGIDKDGDGVEDEPFDPSVVTTVVSGQLNPCAASTCTAEETTAGKDNYEDMIVGTTSGHPTLVYVGTSSGTFAPPIKDDASILSIFQSTNLPSSNTIEDTGSVESIVIQDVDADNLPDVVLFHENGPGRVFFADDQTADVFGNALRVPADFTRSLNTPLGLETETHTSLSFFDHDGKTDTGPYLYVGSTLGTKDRLILDLEEANAAGFSVSNEFSIDLEGTDLFSTKQTQVGATTGNPTSSPIPLDLILGTDAGVKGIQAFFAQVPADKTVEWDVTPLLSDLVTLSDMTGASSEDVKALKVGKVDSDDISDVVFSTGDYTAVLFGKDGALFSDAASLSSWKSSHLVPIRQVSESYSVSSLEIDHVLDTDSDSDLLPDVLAGARNGEAVLFEQTADRTFSPEIFLGNDRTTSTSETPKPYPSPSSYNGGLLLVSQFDGKKNGFPSILSGTSIVLNPCSSSPCPSPDWASQQPHTYWEGSVPEAVSAFDADSDSDLDLIVFPSNPSEEPVLIENVDGKGTFSLSSPRFAFPAGTRKGSVSTLESRDVNDDGISDLIVAYAYVGSSSSPQGRVHIFLGTGSLSTLSGKSSPDVEILLASGVQIKSMSYVEVLDKSNEVAGEEYEDKPRTVRERAILLAVGTDFVRMHTCSSGCGSASGWAEQTMPALDAGMDVLHVSASQLNVRNDLHMDIALLFDAAGAGSGAVLGGTSDLLSGTDWSTLAGLPSLTFLKMGSAPISGRGNIGYNQKPTSLSLIDVNQDGLTDVVFSGEDGTVATPSLTRHALLASSDNDLEPFAGVGKTTITSAPAGSEKDTMDLIVTDLNGDGAMDQIYIEKEIGEDRFGGQAKVQLGVPVANSVLSDPSLFAVAVEDMQDDATWYDKDGNAIGDTGNGPTGIMSTTDYPTTTTVQSALSPGSAELSERPVPFRDRTQFP